MFNQYWELVALHHAGSKNIRCLKNPAERYAANEGISIEAIRREVASCRL